VLSFDKSTLKLDKRESGGKGEEEFRFRAWGWGILEELISLLRDIIWSSGSSPVMAASS
jgi:hypothetical protein